MHGKPNKMGYSQTNSSGCHTHDFFLYLRLMIRWQKKRASKFPRGIRAVFVSDWLAFLIHIRIHGNRRVLHISDGLLMSEDMSSD